MNPIGIAFVIVSVACAIWEILYGSPIKAWYFFSGASITASVLFMKEEGE